MPESFHSTDRLSELNYADALAAIQALSATHPATRINGYTVTRDEGGYCVGTQDGRVWSWSGPMSAEEAAALVTGAIKSFEPTSTTTYDVSSINAFKLGALQDTLEDIFLTHPNAPQWILDAHRAIVREWDRRETINGL